MLGSLATQLPSFLIHRFGQQAATDNTDLVTWATDNTDLVTRGGGQHGQHGAAALAGKLLQGQLYAVHPRDPISYGIAVVLILAGSVVASWIPAYRATTVSPMDALRTE
jgi:hypothetical protein